jgi:DNA-binding LacI/PurR family transcriptional regulator
MAAPKPTSFDIAQLAGVSQPTVSRALRGSPSVSEHTRKRIEAIAQQLNYKVDKNASSLRTQRANTLALLFFEDPTADETGINPFFLSMLASITRQTARRNQDLLISFQQLSANWHVDYEDSRKADGIILLGYGDYEVCRPKLEKLIEQGTHFVRWGFVGSDQIGTTIGCDNFAGGRLAAEHLLAHGRKHIAFLGDTSENAPEFRDRFFGAASAVGGEENMLQIDAISTEQSGFEAAGRLLADAAKFDAIFAASDLIAIGAMRRLAEGGIAIPGDVAVIGFDDIPAAGLAYPPLTTVQQDYRLAGETLVDTLLKLVDGIPTTSEMQAAKLVVRKSCGAH